MLDTESTNTLTFRKDSRSECDTFYVLRAAHPNTKRLKKMSEQTEKTKKQNKNNLNTTERSFMTLYCIVVVWFSCTNQRVTPPPVIQILELCGCEAWDQSTEDCYGYV